MPSKNPPPDKSVLRDIPPLPGVYRFLDGDGRALYVGKAANLKKRAASYFQKNLSPRMRLMMAAMRGVEVTVAASEHAALLLENRLIKTLRPRYNILFRDDKSYPFLRLTAHAYPRLMFYRGDKIGGGEESFYGPFPDSRAVRKTVNILQRVFRLRTCSDSVFSGRSRPCLLHGIGRCSAPCVNKISPARYAADVGAARRLLSGDSRGVESDLRSQMESAAARLEFESAAALRDRLRALAVVRARHFVDGDDSHPDADYAGVCASGGAVCVNVVSVRGGRRLGERRFFWESRLTGGAAAEPGEALSAFVGQHYGAAENPPPIFCECAPLSPTSPPVQQPRGATQKQRAREAAENARIALEMRQAQRTRAADKVKGLATKLDIPPPKRLECFDISHSGGEAPTASRIVFLDGAPATAHYRRFNIQAAGGDDPAAIAEAVGRCYRRTVKEKTAPPDLILIDGGAAQLKAARTALPKELAATPLLAMAKGAARKPGEETLIRDDGEIVGMDSSDPAFHLLQAARDEAHRFAVGGHRLRRDKKRRTSSLEDIEGVGAKRRRMLLNTFGGLRGLKAAGEDELIKIKGVSAFLARRIYAALHEQ